jgi:hypothetical protein
MKYTLEKVGSPEHLHIEEEDVQKVEPVKDGKHAVQLTVRARAQYRFEDGFYYQIGHKSMTVRLVERQVKELIEQDRAEQTAFCTPCYDHAKTDRPGACVRCQVIEAYRRAGKGDLRKNRPFRETGPGNGLVIALVVFILLFWWALFEWGESARRLESVEHQLQAVRLQKR